MRLPACLAVASALACGGTIPGDTQQPLRAPEATIVLIHGMGSFHAGDVDYFYGLPQLYRGLGARVYVPALTPFDSVEARAGQLASELSTLSGPLVLLAHSQGGLDARWLVTRLGFSDRVRAVITIATPHHGSPVADVALGLTPGPVQDAVDVLLGTLGWSLGGAREVTVDFMEHHFNRAVPDAPGVTYWSFSGRAAPFGIGGGNGWLHSPLLATWAFLDATAGASDGMVPEASAHWGRFLGALPADHLGEVDQPLGYTPDFDARGFYTTLLRRIRDEGW